VSAATRNGGAPPDYDAIVIGGGPAGLSAALYLGRARRRTLVLDAGRPRNSPSPAAHGVFTRDGTPPGELLAEARRQLAAYPTVELQETEAVAAFAEPNGYTVRLQDGSEARARRLLLACGVRDELPPIPGLAENWGTSVLHCAYCHGYEVADQPLALYARGQDAMESAASLFPLSRDLLLCTDGPSGLTTADRQRLEGRGVGIVEAGILRVSGTSSQLALHFADCSTVMRRAIFVNTTLHPASRLPVELGCKLDGPSRLVVGANWETTVPGVYAAGDVAAPRKQAVVAAASGAEAAMALNGALVREDFEGESSGYATRPDL